MNRASPLVVSVSSSRAVAVTLIVWPPGISSRRSARIRAATERTSVRAVAFNQSESEGLLAETFDIAFVLRRREGPDPYEIHVREIVAQA